jgi:hypothetical protein
MEKMINGKKCVFHHEAWCRGYMSRKITEGWTDPYNGRFGQGFTIEKPSWDSTNFHKIQYWIYA